MANKLSQRRGPIRENDKPHTSIASKVGSIKPTLNVAPSNANSFTHNFDGKMSNPSALGG